MANEHQVSTNAGGNKKKTAGIILFWIGIVGIFFFLVAIYTCLSSGSDPDYIPLAMIAGAVLFISLPMAVVGASLFFVGKSEEKKQRNLRDAHDSRSDYNKTIRKS